MAEQPGRIMSAEIAERPAMLRRTPGAGAPEIRGTARSIAAKSPRFVLLAVRGTSGNAALCAKYLLEIRLGLPCGPTSMSTTTAYGARPDLRDVPWSSRSASPAARPTSWRPPGRPARPARSRSP